MGGAFRHLRQPESAKKCFLEAVAIRRALAAERPAVYQSDLALTLNHLGSLQNDCHELEAARQSYQEAVALYRGAARQDPKLFEIELCRCLQNLGALRRSLGEPAAGLPYLRDALSLARKLHQKQPQRLIPELAWCLSNLGNSLSALGELPEAMSHVEEAVRVFRPVAEQGPEIYQHQLAVLLNNVEAVRKQLGNPRADRSEEVVALYRRLALRQPLVYHPFLAVSLSNLATEQFEAGESAAACDALREATRLFAEDAAVRPTAFLTTRLHAWNLLGRVYQIGAPDPDLTSARQAFREAFDCAEQLRGQFIDPAQRERVQADAIDAYELLFRTNVALWEASGDEQAVREAVEVAEASRARNLNELLADELLSPAGRRRRGSAASGPSEVSCTRPNGSFMRSTPR